MSVRQSILESYVAQRPKSIRYYDRACRAMAGGVGHDLRHLEPVPLYIKHGKAGRKWDVDNNEYVDFLLGNGALLMGHAPSDIVEAIAEALGCGTHFGNDHPLHIEWAERVQQLIPSAERVRFVNSGTEATQLALRIARAFSGRSKILRFEGHFHGWHDYLSMDSGINTQVGIPDETLSTIVVIEPTLDALSTLLERDTNIAAVIMEPTGGHWGRTRTRSIHPANQAQKHPPGMDGRGARHPLRGRLTGPQPLAQAETNSGRRHVGIGRRGRLHGNEG